MHAITLTLSDNSADIARIRTIVDTINEQLSVSNIGRSISRLFGVPHREVQIDQDDATEGGGRNN